MSKKDDFKVFEKFVDEKSDFESVKSKITPKELGSVKPAKSLNKRKFVLLTTLASVLVVAIILSVIFIPFGFKLDRTANTSANLGDNSVISANLSGDDPITGAYAFEQTANVHLSKKAFSALNKEYASTREKEVEVIVYVCLYRDGYEEYDELMRLIALMEEDYATYRPQAVAFEEEIMAKEESWLKTLGFSSVEQNGFCTFIVKGKKQSLRKVYEGRLFYTVFFKEEVEAPEVSVADIYGTYTATACVYISPCSSHIPAYDEKGNLVQFTFDIGDDLKVEEVEVDHSAANYYGFDYEHIVFQGLYAVNGNGSFGSGEFLELMLSDYKKFEVYNEKGVKFVTFYVTSENCYARGNIGGNNYMQIFKLKKERIVYTNICISDFCGEAHFDLAKSFDEWTASILHPDNLSSVFSDEAFSDKKSAFESVKETYNESYFETRALLVINYGICGYIENMALKRSDGALVLDIEQDFGRDSATEGHNYSNYLCVEIYSALLDGVTELKISVGFENHSPVIGTAEINEHVVVLS